MSRPKVASRATRSAHKDQQRHNKNPLRHELQLIKLRAQNCVNSYNPENPHQIRAALAATNDHEYPTLPWWQRLMRWMLAIALLPLCVASTYTFIQPFAQLRLSNTFTSEHFYFFIIGVLLMIGWHFSGVCRKKFLYLYVMGHELTHMLFIIIHRGKIMDHHISYEGGYVTTDKANTLIALSPYMLPFWTLCLLPLYFLHLLLPLPQEWHFLLFTLTGFTWTFHFLWTTWMIPADQPDLRENDTFFSIIIIYLTNILLLSLMFSLANSSMNTAELFGNLWQHSIIAYQWIYEQILIGISFARQSF